jgi:hypothetical protein
MKGTYADFINALGAKESSNNYRAVNQFGFMGRWQFGKPRLYDLGLSIDGWHPNGRPVKTVLSKEDFLNSRQIQDMIMLKHVSQIKNLAMQRYPEYLGKVINGVTVTLSGMVAGVHLKGWGVSQKDVPNSKQGLRHFLLYGMDPVDGNYTKLSSYVQKFGGYRFDNVPQAEVHKNNIEFISNLQPRPIEPYMPKPIGERLNG